MPLLNELPPPPTGKEGWPWTEAAKPLPALTPSGQPWPKVSVVTPSYNQGQFLEETIRSVLLQGYPNLEYILIDGGSDDQSVQIIKQYEKWLTHWVSEKDRGQTAAINKGFAVATGSICAYLNSDDVYLPNAVHQVVRNFEDHPEAGLMYGDCQLVDESSQVFDVWLAPDFDLSEFAFRCYIPQPATFWRSSTHSKVGEFNVAMHFAFDYEMWLRMAAQDKLVHAPLLLAQHRKAQGTKTMSTPEAFGKEILAALRTFFRLPGLPAEVKLIERDAYSFAAIDQALLNFRLGRVATARQDLESAFQHSADIVRRERERITRALVTHADPSNQLAATDQYLELVFAELPESAGSLLPLKQSVLRRVEILHAARSKNGRELRRARRLLLPALFDDFSWLRNQEARREFLSVLIGHTAIRRLVAFRHSISGARESVWQ